MVLCYSTTRLTEADHLTLQDQDHWLGWKPPGRGEPPPAVEGQGYLCLGDADH